MFRFRLLRLLWLEFFKPAIKFLRMLLKWHTFALNFMWCDNQVLFCIIVTHATSATGYCLTFIVLVSVLLLLVSKTFTLTSTSLSTGNSLWCCGSLWVLIMPISIRLLFDKDWCNWLSFLWFHLLRAVTGRTDLLRRWFWSTTYCISLMCFRCCVSWKRGCAWISKAGTILTCRGNWGCKILFAWS